MNRSFVSRSWTAVACLMAAVGPAAVAQSPTPFTGDYFQDFSTLRLGGSGEIPGAVNNLNTAPYPNPSLPSNDLLGWRHRRGSGSTTAQTFNASTGTDVTGRAYSYGADGAGVAADRAFGLLGSGSNVNSVVGVVLRNDTGADITSVSLSYVGEQWRTGGRGAGDTSADRLEVYYRVVPTGVGDISGTTPTGYTPVTALNFNSPVVGTATGAALDGNAAANRTAVNGTIALDTTWAAGTQLVIQWRDFDVAGVDDGLAIDDVRVLIQPVPEPAGLLLVGAAVGVLRALRRRR